MEEMLQYQEPLEGRGWLEETFYGPSVRAQSWGFALPPGFIFQGWDITS
jgi:hypothetical protein